ncbi:hypothetical protein JYU34_008789 [Plutella xylostella]|uniref:Rad21/Rec8-like protein N-terminal domain-containing protein n=1 Tax=Plutella xylostella TaxID=51655 RepID=A0ABQ7QLX6_PLUXY|nr:hypothetical protein JYU34_008789 [Plutella xylostella]
MFYPVESLRRGGRFYLCWVADSWPLRFATITHRQLWSQDIRQICDDLLDVYTRESGYASARFSLRLSSQLMRGLVRLYQKKVTVFLSDLCMINATAIKHTHHRPVHHGAPARKREAVPRLEPAVVEEIPGNEDKLEERIQASGNVVANIEEITLKELAIPEIQIPADGFGEENPEQALQDLLANRTVEEMLGHTAASAQLSDLLALDTTDKSIQNKSRLAPNEPLMMERISEHDMTLFRKSTAANDLIPMEDVEKVGKLFAIDLTISYFDYCLKISKDFPEVAEEQAQAPATSKEKEMMDIELELEELGEIERQPKRKRARRLIVDKRTKISGLVLRHRLEHVNLELRCEDSSEDIIDPLRLPAEVYLQRPACVGWRPQGNVSCRLLRLFKQNLGFVERAEHNFDMEQMLAEGVRRHKARMPLTKIVEEVAAQDVPRVVVEPPAPDATLPEEFLAQNITEGRPSIAVEPIDIMDLPTQVLMTECQEARKRAAEIEDLHASGAKKLCQRSGTMSFRQSQLEIEEAALVEVEAQKRSGEKENHSTSMKSPQAPRKSARRSRASNKSDKSVEKLLDLPAPPTYHEQEMINPEVVQKSPEVVQKSPEQEKEMHVSQMLEEVGLADARNLMAAELRQSQHKAQSGEESSETQLGSLDRTKVDFGDSDKTTDTQRFLRKEWGTQGTMLKVVRMLHQQQGPLSVRVLVGRGPAPSGLERIVAARCFTALLKLKQHAFVVLSKDPTSLEITDISCGAKFRLP